MSDAGEPTERLVKAIEVLSARVAALEKTMRTPRKPWRVHVIEQLRSYGENNGNR